MLRVAGVGGCGRLVHTSRGAPALRGLRGICGHHVLHGERSSTRGGSEGATVPVLITGAGPVGLTLALSLAKQGVRSTVIDRFAAPTTHPQAHFINTRTMEVLRSIRGGLADKVASAGPPRQEWGNFVYCKDLTGLEICTFHHFGRDPQPMLRDMAARSPCMPVHLAQTRLLPILLEEVAANADMIDLHLQHELVDFQQPNKQSPSTPFPEGPGRGADNSGGVSVVVRDLKAGAEKTIAAKYLVGCDGASSRVRAKAGIEMNGPGDVQCLVNIHFFSKQLGTRLLEMNRAGMLYFMWNEEVIAVMVAHDLGRGEFVLQVPYFPPFETISSDFSPEKCRRIVEAAAGIPGMEMELKTVRGWKMAAMIADRYQAGSVFVAGDAAHFFPPAGAFGMNTGMQDAHNLAWKLAHMIHGSASGALVERYSIERQMIAQQNADLSVRNVKGVWDISSALGMNPQHAEAVITTAKYPPLSLLPEGARASFIKNTLKLGKQQLRTLESSLLLGRARVQAARRLIEGDKGLGLLFHGQDIGFHYKVSDALMNMDKHNPAHVPSSTYHYIPSIAPGARFPHFWLKDSSLGQRVSSLDVVSDPLGKMQGFVLFAFGVQRQMWAEAASGIVRICKVDETALEEPLPSCFNGAAAVLVRPDGHVAWRSYDAAPPPTITDAAALIKSAVSAALS